jgi:hypothetical protein
MSHHHHDHSCSHEHHEHDDHDVESALQYSLYKYIDLDNVTCLNEATPNSIRNVFKPYHERIERTKYVESDCDEQLIVHIPFTGMIKLKAISLLCENGDMAASALKVY